MGITINGEDPGAALQGLLKRLVQSDPDNKLQNRDQDITEAEARALLNRVSDEAIDEQDLEKINQGVAIKSEQMAAADLATLAEVFQRSFPKGAPVLSSSLLKAREDFAKAQRVLPSLVYDEFITSGASFRGAREASGCINPMATPQGTIVFNAWTLSGSSTKVQRNFYHELVHQRWDRMDHTARQRLMEAFQKHYSLSEAKQYLLGEPQYKNTYKQLLATQGQEAADLRVVDECVAHMLTHFALPSAKSILVNEPSPKEKATLVARYGSEEAVRKVYAAEGRPWYEPKTDEDVMWLIKNRPDLDDEDLDPVLSRVHGLAIKPEFLTVAQEVGLIVPRPDADAVIEMARRIQAVVHSRSQRP